ncbi:MAG: hypothetical protein H0X37_24700 [Herpetosiphonaceae bacterium]|nr:hypothetical protein [Herpetosiphonaceae bacterium]
MAAKKYVPLLVLLGILVVALVPPLPALAATILYPDLRIKHVDTFELDTTTMPGHRLLRFTSIMVNVGAGAFEVRGYRLTTGSNFLVYQREYDTAGGHRDVLTPAHMVYDVGDGHTHWHLKNLQKSTLVALGSTQQSRTGAKIGFCFFDNAPYNLSLPGAPPQAVYNQPPACSPNDPNALAVLMGLSIGWEDIYSFDIAQQWIDITGLPNGAYRLTVTADHNHHFAETDNTNNFTWVDIWIGNNGVTILLQGPGA